ncbi:MAG: PilT/PilU family type 4a pilus ATPase [Acidobacteria bacterium]|nr:PilT/PilU family type 4a pilus ATPase [Acidobacteriota bacterium]
MPIDFNLLKTLAGHSYDVNAVAFSRDGSLLASGGGDGTVRLWNVADPGPAGTAEHGEWINSVCFAPSGQHIASGSRDGSAKLYTVDTGQVLGTIQAHPGKNVSTVVFSPDGRRLATAGGDGHVRIFDLKEKKIERDLSAHTGWVWSASFSSLGDRLLTSGSDGAARVWSAETGQMLVAFDGHADDVLSAAFSPDDHFAVTACKDGGVSFWEVDSGRMLFRVVAHQGAANSVNYAPDGLHIATAGADHLINVWSIETMQKVRELSGHQDYVAAAVFSRDGLRMASCGGDGTVKIWEVTDKAAYSSSSSFDPELEIEHEETSRPEVVSSVYAAGKIVAESSLKSGIRIALLASARDKFSIAVGESQRTCVTIAGDQVNVISGTGTVLLKYDLTQSTIVYDRTDGASAPWSDEGDREPARAMDPNLENFGGGGSGGLGVPFELERAAGGGYQSFERHGRSLARERMMSGHTLRLVQFDADTVYVLFDQSEEPTVVLRGENLDVRDVYGKAAFRMNLRSFEPVVSRRGPSGLAGEAHVMGDGSVVQTGFAGSPELEPLTPARDPLLVHGLTEMAGEESGGRIHKIIEKAVWQSASDVHVPSGAQVQMRRHGQLQPLGGRTYSADEIESMILEILTPEQRKRFLETNDLDFSYEIKGVGRFRANVCRQHRGVDATFRVVPDSIPSFEQLGLPQSILPLTRQHNGLVLITGPAGQGKSTTIACLVDLINSEKPHHIITVEDPIEFVHPVKVAVVNQREVGRHTKSFANALRASLREDPDVIVVGEMRDLETISLAITASETGHLVFGTLMTSSAAQTIDRVLDSFPAGQQAQIRTMLSESLRGVISQQLVPTTDGEGRVLACEVLLGTPAVANLIRERKTFQLMSVMQTSRNIGMQRMDDALFDLYTAGRIGRDNALRYSQDQKNMELRLAPKTGGAPGGEFPTPGGRRV